MGHRTVATGEAQRNPWDAIPFTLRLLGPGWGAIERLRPSHGNFGKKSNEIVFPMMLVEAEGFLCPFGADS